MCNEFLVDANDKQLLKGTWIVAVQLPVDIERIVTATRRRDQPLHNQTANVTEHLPTQVSGGTRPGADGGSRVNDAIRTGLSTELVRRGKN